MVNSTSWGEVQGWFVGERLDQNFVVSSYDSDTNHIIGEISAGNDRQALRTLFGLYTAFLRNVDIHALKLFNERGEEFDPDCTIEAIGKTAKDELTFFYALVLVTPPLELTSNK